MGSLLLVRPLARFRDRGARAVAAHIRRCEDDPCTGAILIEALEPRQNRKRGDDLSAVEYIQCEDPEIQKKRVKESLELALNKM